MGGARQVPEHVLRGEPRADTLKIADHALTHTHTHTHTPFTDIALRVYEAYH